MRRQVPVPFLVAFWIVCSAAGCVVGNLATMYVLTQVMERSVERTVDRAVDKAVGKFAPIFFEGK